MYYLLLYLLNYNTDCCATLMVDYNWNKCKQFKQSIDKGLHILMKKNKKKQTNHSMS